ncbi:MAG: archease, partial [Thioalkalispiraceae bacterium]
CISLECDAEDREYLFVDWLNALVYEMATRHMLFSQFDVKIQDGHLQARVCGEKVDRNRHQPAVEIKGATLTELRVKQQQDGRWLAQCIVDV